MAEPKYPNITVKLTGKDGNAFAILGRMVGAMAKAGLDAAEIKQFRAEATAGNYDHLLQTCFRWVSIR